LWLLECYERVAMWPTSWNAVTATFAEHVRPSGVLIDRDSTEEVVASVPKDVNTLP
jgi:hypothetical protein